MPKTSAPAHGWWGEQWLAYMTHEAGMRPLTGSQVRGAERGDAKLDVTRGKVTATVGVGGYGGTHAASLKVKPLTDRDWKRVLEALGENAVAAHRLLTGAPGAELQEAFAAAGVALFPSAPALRCTCWERWGCRHQRVLAVRGAVLLDANPFLWLEALGRSREDLLAAVRARLADVSGRPEGLGAPWVGVSADRFLTTPVDPEAIEVKAGVTATPDALLRLLGALPLPPDVGRTVRQTEREVTRGGNTFFVTALVQETPDEVLARYLTEISQAATGLGTGERAPRFADEPVPGKKVPLKVRLTEEIAETVTGRDTPVSLTELHVECPTAAAMPWKEAETALTAALAGLPPEFVTLAGRHVGVRSAILAGLTFRHVVTFSEWQAGHLQTDTDWARLLTTAGFEPPYDLQAGAELCPRGDGLFAALKPELGDELELTVTDPERPLLMVTLTRRDDRYELEQLEANREAVRLLREHMEDDGDRSMPEWKAAAVLLSEGFHRNGRLPDPTWLLPLAAPDRDLFWTWGRALTVAAWQQISPTFGRPLYGVWKERQNAMSQFGASLLEQGFTRKDAEAALSCVEIWCRHWPADQSDPRHRPAVGALAHFLWNTVPADGVRVRGLAEESFPRMLAAWFRFLQERMPKPKRAFADHIALCSLEEAFIHRLRTLPAAGRGVRERMEGWLLEGYRWLGPELVFGQQE